MRWRLRELAKFLLNIIQTIEVSFLRLIGVVDFPVPPNSNMRRTSARTIKHYFFSSLTTSLPIATMGLHYGVKFDNSTKVLDFGCGAGSQLMSLTRYFPDAQYFACDVDPSSVAFVSKNYPMVEVSNNAFMPPLKFQDGEMDLIYTVSTFSHFDLPTQQQWLAELFRVVKPGGIVLPTIESAHALPAVLSDFPSDRQEVEEILLRDGIFYKEYSWLKELQKRGAALTPNLDIASYFGDTYGHTVITGDFVRKHWVEAGFEVLGIVEGVIAARQDLVILRRPAK